MVAEANEIAGYIQLPEGGGWVVFNRTNSTAYPDTGAGKSFMDRGYK